MKTGHMDRSYVGLFYIPPMDDTPLEVRRASPLYPQGGSKTAPSVNLTESFGLSSRLFFDDQIHREEATPLTSLWRYQPPIFCSFGASGPRQFDECP